MIGKDRSKQIVGHALMDAPTGFLKEHEVTHLWEIFRKIVEYWHDGKYVPNVPENYFGQWHEFIELNTQQSPSYTNEYRSGLTVLAELKTLYSDDYWTRLFFDNGLQLYNGKPYELPDRATRLGHFKLYVVDEFIDVFLTCGGFRQFKKSGAGNYNSFIFQSRYNKMNW